MDLHDTDIEDVYGVGLLDEDENGENASSSSSTSNLETHVAPSPPVNQAISFNSSNRAPQLVFRHDVDEAVLRAASSGEGGGCHERTC